MVEDAFDDQGGQLQRAFGNAFSDAEDVGSSPAFNAAGVSRNLINKFN